VFEHLEARAKLTLSLRILGVRADGLHVIDAEMVSLDLCDRLVIDSDGDELTVVTGSERSVGRPDDLVVRALKLVRRRAGVELHKHIAPGAGLGGGSSDAAAILRWAGEFDPDRAALLGADVAFCVVGGRAMVGGIGEVIAPMDHRPETFTLLTPPVHCSTPVVYRTWDELGGPVGDHGNDLEPAALHAFPELARWRDELGDASGQRPFLAGSGSTWVVRGEHPGPGRIVARTTGRRDEPGPGTQ